MNQGSYYSRPDLGDLVVHGQLGGEMPQEFCSTSCPNIGLLVHDNLTICWEPDSRRHEERIA